MKTARETYEKGDRVVLTAMAKRAGISPRSDRGVVVGFCRSPFLVQVRPGGRKTATSYHVDFWRPAPRPPRES